MIFPKGCGAVTVLAKHFSQWRYTIRTYTGISRKGSSQLHDGSGIVYVMVAACQQRGARWRAKGGGVETVITQTTRSELIKRWHIDRPAKGAGGSKTDIVKQNDHNIGRFCRRFHFETRGCFCIPGIKHC